jgi:hypothetical protein
VPQKEPAERIKEGVTSIEEDSDLGPQKKPRMRTAKEVINRIKWDADFIEVKIIFNCVHIILTKYLKLERTI